MVTIDNNESGDASWGQRGTAGASFAGEVALEDVSFRIKEKTILDRVSVHFKAGQVASLLGPSGCGKTTLLRLIAGVSRPTAGRVLLDTFEVAGDTNFVPPERRNIGLVFQDYALFPHMSVLQNVTYGLYALSRREAETAAMRALERVGLGAHAHKYPHQLSGGEQQRVALARAIVPRPQVILLDEPFSGLDQRLREQVRSETLAVIRETRATAILVTHDPQEAMDAADQIHVLRNGTIAQSGSARDLLQKPVDADVARFFGAGTVLKGRIARGHVITALGAFSATTIAEGVAVDVLVRPRAIKPGSGAGSFRAYVSELRFLGDEQRLILRVPQLDYPVEALVDAHLAIKIGQEQAFTIDHKGVFVFKSPP